MNCARCGAPLPRPDVRFCTACGAPVGQQPGGPPGPPPQQPPGSGYPPPPGRPQYPQGQYPPPPYGQQHPQYGDQQGWGPPPYGSPDGPPPRSGPNLVPILGIAALLLLMLAGAAVFFLTQIDDSPLAIGRADPTRTPTPTVAPTATRQPGIGINIPGRDGTPTQVTIPLPIPGLGAGGAPGASGSPSLPIPILSGTPDLSALPGASGTPPPSAKLTADGARDKVKDTITNCRLLQAQIEASVVTFEPPNWTVKLPLTGATWTVSDETGNVTPDERAAERMRNCRI